MLSSDVSLKEQKSFGVLSMCIVNACAERESRKHRMICETKIISRCFTPNSFGNKNESMYSREE